MSSLVLGDFVVLVLSIIHQLLRDGAAGCQVKWHGNSLGKKTHPQGPCSLPQFLLSLLAQSMRVTCRRPTSQLAICINRGLLPMP